jgi:hypothetical protein
MNTGTSGVWSGANGPVISLFIGGMVLRYWAIAVASTAVKCERFSHGMIGASVLPAGIFPVVKAVTISVVLHFPIPVSASGVKFDARKTPSPGIENPMSDPARNLYVCS